MHISSLKTFAAALALLALLAVAGCTTGPDALVPSGAATRMDPSGTHVELGPTLLRVMSFNIWLGGELVDLGKVVEAIKLSGADVVGLQESEGNARRIADLLGWAFADERLQIISRHPLISPPDGNGIYTFIQLAPGQVVAMSNIHLPSNPYGPELVRDGSLLEQVLANEVDIRMAWLQVYLPHWRTLIAAGMPLLLAGDFNTPSHRDWTAAAVGARAHVLYPVQWPVTLAVEQLGFVDTYRAVHANAQAKPGITWTYGYPHPRLRANEVQDRIDLVFVAGALHVVDSRVVGPAGERDVDVAVDPYPSDHLGVVSTISLDPVEPPVFVAVAAVRVEAGTPLGVHYHAPGGEGSDRLVVVRAGADAVTNALAALPPQEAGHFGRVNFGTGGLQPGEYAVVLLGAADNELSRSAFWVVAPGAVPSVSADAALYKSGAPITAAWSAAPARKFDWVGIYKADDPDLFNYLAFAYTNATVAGTYPFGAADLGDGLLAPGEYELRLMSDDGYACLAAVRFAVVE